MIKKAFFVLLICALLFPITSSQDFAYNYLYDVGDIAEDTNSSTLNVNNSEYLQGYTPTTLQSFFQTTYDTVYVPYDGATGDVNLSDNKLTVNDVFPTTNGVGSIGDISNTWNAGFFNGIGLKTGMLLFPGATTTGDFIPLSSNADDIGSTSSGFRNGYFQTGVKILTDNGVIEQGAAGDFQQYWSGTKHINNVDSGAHLFTGGNMLIGTETNHNKLTIVDSTDLQLSLGTSDSTRWSLGRNEANGHFQIEEPGGLGVVFDISQTNGDTGLGTERPNARFELIQTLDNKGLNIRRDSSSVGEVVSTKYKISTNEDDLYYKAGILFERTDASYGRGELHLAVDSGTDSGSVQVSDSVLTLGYDKSVSMPWDNAEFIQGVAGDFQQYWSGTKHINNVDSGAHVFTGGNVGIGTTDPTEKVDINGSIIQDNGNAYINNIYGSVSGDEIGEIIISSIGVYYNVTNTSQGLLNGFTFNTTGQGGLTAQYDGVYELMSGWSFSGSANTEYHLRLAINGAEANNCHAQRKIGTGGDVGSASTVPCFVELNIGDTVTMQIENVDNVNDATIHDVGMTIKRLGNL